MNAHSPLTREDAVYLGLDIGGTTVKWMLVTDDGTPVERGYEPTRTDLEQQVRDLAKALRATAPQLRGCGVICPGIVDETAGVVRYAANVNLTDVHLAETVAEATGCPAHLGHDGRAAGLAAGLLGAGRGVASFAMLPIGTGIAVALVSEGHVRGGDTLCAGEIGHTPVAFDGEPCPCGQSGCLEVYASARAIGRRYAARTGKDIGTPAVEGLLGSDPVADEVWDEAVHALAHALAHLVLVYDPGSIVIGGGLSRAGDALFAPLAQRLAEHMSFRTPPPLLKAELGEDAGLWGALILATHAAGTDDASHWNVEKKER